MLDNRLSRSFTPLTSLSSILVFILTLLLLSADFYYLKNIAGRRLVGLRWWNEVNTTSGDSHWVFESSDPNVRTISATDKRFFWLSLYLTPALWVGLAILAIVRLVGVIWLSLVGEYLFCYDLWKSDLVDSQCSLNGCSHCPHPNAHEYCGLLAVRQVQSGIDIRKQGFGWWNCEQSCGWPAGQVLPVIAWRWYFTLQDCVNGGHTTDVLQCVSIYLF